MSFGYLASPYSHADAEVRNARYHTVCELLAKLANDGAIAYSPIVHWHNVAHEYKMRTDAEFWKRHNFALLRSASHLIVARIEGWDRSVGVREEIDFAKSIGLPIYYIEPTTQKLSIN